MIDGARQLALKHLSIRVPWHDTGWTGHICRSPRNNSSCLFLRRIGLNRDDAAEEALAGQPFDTLSPAQYPPCIEENVSFLSASETVRHKRHPYADFSDKHRHFAPTPLRHPPFSAACIPFRWMLRKEAFGDARVNTNGLVSEYQLDASPDREPDLGRELRWIQEKHNQLVLLDTFFSAVRPGSSLCFFYAKRTPLADDPRRVLIGVARVTSIGEAVEYKYTTNNPALLGVLWERMIGHSLRPQERNGFLLPYHALLERAAVDATITPSDFAAFAPASAWDAYSYATEHVSDDDAIESLLSCASALQRLANVVEGDFRSPLAWIDNELNRLWRLRGAFPGFGSALRALGIEQGTLIAHAISQMTPSELSGVPDNPWKTFERVIEKADLLPPDLSRAIGKGYRRVWQTMESDRRALLQLLSRFALTAEQAVRFFQPTERRDAGIEVQDTELLRNPYLLYELDRERRDGIPVTVIDRGEYPDPIVATKHPLPPPSALEDAVDPRRVRALIVDTLETAATAGHTLLPSDDIIRGVRARELRPPCPLGPDVLTAAKPTFQGILVEPQMGNGRPALQLAVRSRCSELIRREVTKRSEGRRHEGDHSWRNVIDTVFGPPAASGREDVEAEERARKEKAAALEELFRARLTLLLGAAGTGKTTLLRVLCKLPEVERGGVLLLAPTGKARVRLEIGTGRTGGLTVAQFLLRLGRFDGNTGRYKATGDARREGGYKTVVVDEASMLTEDQLAAVIDGLTGVERLVIVGDTRQLPPIGPGRPLVDIATKLAPPKFDVAFPKVAQSIAELTVIRRQGGGERDDVLFARSFADDGADAAVDEVWRRVLAGESPNVSVVSWSSPEQLQQQLLDRMVDELRLSSDQDEVGFALSLGGTEKNGWTYYNAAYGDKRGASDRAEAWQVLGAVRAHGFGVDALNRLIQTRFRAKTIASARPERDWHRRIPKPKGPQQLVYGDKVINVVNELHRDIYPKGDPVFIANGDIGVIIGQFKTANFPGPPWKIEVEFSTRQGIKCGYHDSYFGDEASPPLELAYALTIHKTQGSEFGTTFLVLPNPCWLLSRELLYTALTRHRERLVILCQGDPRELRKYGSPAFSEVSARLTNLFAPAHPVLVHVGNTERFLERSLIHRTERGELVRSKSEVIIADKLFARGVEYGYEQPVRLADGADRYPDFTIVDSAAGITYYWEHLGLLSDAGYRRRWEQKIRAYRSTGILPQEEGGGPNGSLLVTWDEPNGGIDSGKMAALVDRIAG
jgi:energy-coupling factor transporter ATP-binding protein EcfA2